MMRKIANCILLSIVLMSLIAGCDDDSDATNGSTYLYSIEQRDSVPGGKIDTFRVEKYKAPAGKKFLATAIFKSNAANTYPSKVLGEGEVLYVFFQTHGQANATNRSQKFGFFKDMPIGEVTYNDLYKKLDVKDSCVSYFNTFKEKYAAEFPDGNDVYNAAFFHSVYANANTISIPTTKGKGYVSFVVE